MITHKIVRVDLGDRGYDITIGANLLSNVQNFVPVALKDSKIFVLYDKAVEAHVEKLVAAFPAVPCKLALAGGEKTKSYEHLQQVLAWLLQNRVDRKSVLFTVGGGVIGDLGGFAASIVLRGIPFVQVPTTLLSQVDSSVGGKTGINTHEGKNLVGSFYQPITVLCDTQVLATLPEREIKAGYAEIVKYGLLGSYEFFEWLERNGQNILALNPEQLARAIEVSCMMKADIVGRDEREMQGGRRALLNLGHTFAHALEAAAGFDGRLLHGEAVSIGMVLAFRLCVQMGLCTGQDAARMEAHLKSVGMITKISDISPALTYTAEEIVSLMYHDKKASGGKVGFILAHGIGQAFQSSDVDMDDVLCVLKESSDKNKQL